MRRSPPGKCASEVGSADHVARSLSAELAHRVRANALVHLDTSTAQRFLEDWRDRGQGPDIFAYDLDEGKETRLTKTHDAFEPAISDRWVVWVGRADQGVFAAVGLS